MAGAPASLLADLALAGPGERFDPLLARAGIRLERIVSAGHATPPDAPLCQPHDEWVLLVAGAAGLWVEGVGEVRLAPGDHLLIPGGRLHRVTFTDADAPTVWLALHLAGDAVGHAS